VLRGIEARCVACGAVRPPFAPLQTTTVNLAGQPSRVGGWVMKGLGCGVATLGTALTVGLVLLGQSCFPGSYVGWALGLPVGLLSLVAAVAMLLGGTALRRSGERARDRARRDGVRALAAARSGVLAAADVAQALSLAQLEAEAVLNAMAHDPAEQVSLELDDDGVVRYLFGEQGTAAHWQARLARRVRVAAEAGAQDPDARAEAELQAQAEAEVEAALEQRKGR
jgi:hypothetical protein